MAIKKTLEDTLPLPNAGGRIPQLGFGVWQSPPEMCMLSCLEALRAGYRHIDTAQIYGNEAEVGDAVRRSGLTREAVFITTKIMFAAETPEDTYARCCASVQKLGRRADYDDEEASDDPAAYVDLFLVHSPLGGSAKRALLWKTLERLHAEGRARAIGVSNFGIGQIESMRTYAAPGLWPPAVNQIELHPWSQQREIVAYCVKQGIVVEAYCPLVRGHKTSDPTLAALAKKHSSNGQDDSRIVTPSHILLRYALQRGWVPLPKSDTPARIRANADLYHFELDAEDMKTLDELDQGAAGSILIAVRNGDNADNENPFGGGRGQGRGRGRGGSGRGGFGGRGGWGGRGG
ncbi:Aldo/keto reductase [Niveomyces insectorum RCEF 264]|uniref:Aldo/keto reductase n=1 Tax=Niveomyces insectorum RCEF 264 TaxID=1081102 RepID=A0A167Y0K0_9HYPO|nr:Aldo/keto reductase [Niveomyces insectorum RCEF 264]